MKNVCSIVFAVCLAFFLSGCAPHLNYHPNLAYQPKSPVCPLKSAAPPPEDECNAYALQEYQGGNEGYLLGFVELNEQGQLFDRQQLHQVIGELNRRTDDRREDLVMLVYVHGWHHNASPKDTNLKTFRHVLTKISLEEGRDANNEGRKPRQVAGVFVGWRGDSVSVEGLNNITFWDRKNTAQKVGYGGLTEILTRIERVKTSKNQHDKKNEPDKKEETKTKLVVIGHSFGGAAVLSALSQVLNDRFVNAGCRNAEDRTRPDCDNQGYAKLFGNLVLLINPAIEAQRFATLHDMSFERASYQPDQLPIMAVLASENDWPVNNIFPLGRWFSTLFEKEQKYERYFPRLGKQTINEHDTNLTALGHYEPYTTHRLSLQRCKNLPTDDMPAFYELASDEWAFLQYASKSWRAGNLETPFASTEDVDGKSKISEMCLTSFDKTARYNPYLVISADKKIIDGHNDLTSEKMKDFVTALIYLSIREPAGQSNQAK